MSDADEISENALLNQQTRLSAAAAATFPSLTREFIVRDFPESGVMLFVDLRTRDGQRYAVAFPFDVLVRMNNTELLEAVRLDGIRLGLITRIH